MNEQIKNTAKGLLFFIISMSIMVGLFWFLTKDLPVVMNDGEAFNSTGKLEGIYKLTPSQKFQALCPFNCIDLGYNGGYYSNLNKKCNCYKK